jgi:hypothetical protein
MPSLCTALYLVTKYAVSAGIKLAADDLRHVPAAFTADVDATLALFERLFVDAAQ